MVLIYPSTLEYLMAADPDDSTDQLNESTQDSIDRLHSLVEDLKSVQEHEKRITTDGDPPSR
jgi:hypothetical protein